MTKTCIPEMLKASRYNCLRTNPDRGWRLETYIFLGRNTTVFHESVEPEAYLDEELERYKEYPFSLVQAYVYLTDYINKPIDEKAFSQLEAYLKAFRNRGLRVLLRFAYEYEDNRKIGPHSKIIYNHTEQIKKWFEENESLCRDTVFVLQAGMVGVWGEWHTAKYYHNKKTSLLKICDMTPDYLTVQIRRQKFKNKIRQSEQWNRVGYHDDYLVGVYHKWSTPEHGVGSSDFSDFIEESKNTLNDGEMPWGRDKYHNNGYIDGLEFIKGCALRSLTTLSLTHNCIEDGKEYNAYRWQKELLTKKKAEELSLPFDSSYFDDGDKTIFDYITDHLGYQLAVEKIQIDGQNVSVTIKNNGFALPYGFTEFCIYTESDGNVKKYKSEDYSYKALTSGSRQTITVMCDGEFDKLGIEIRKPIDCLKSVRFANECDYANNINWFEIK